MIILVVVVVGFFFVFFFFPLTEAKKDFLYPCHILVAVMEEEIRRTNSTSYNE